MTGPSLRDALVQARRPPVYRFKTEALGEDGTFAGYGSVFSVVDSYGDIVLPGAFTESIAVKGALGIKLLWQHDALYPIGVWTELREDERGLYCKGRLLPEVEKARETLALMKAGALDGLSIGYDVTAVSYARPDDLEAAHGIKLDPLPPPAASGQYRMIESVDLWEISVVTFPACMPARVETVKADAPPPRALDSINAALARRGAALRSF